MSSIVRHDSGRTNGGTGLQNRGRAEFPDVAFTLVVDCGDTPGYALACLRAGIARISMAEHNEKIADIARQMNAELVRRAT